MARGRKVVPAALKLVRGNPGRRPVSKRKPSPSPKGKVGTPPDFLAPEAKEAWRRLKPICEDMGTLSTAMQPAFEALCETYGEWRKYRKMLNEEGGRIKEHPTKKGAFLYNPVGFVDKIEKRLQFWLTVFGLTPESLSRVTPAGPAKEENPFAAFGGGRK